MNQALPVIDMNEDYPEKEIVLQDIADISYIPLETNDEFLFDGSVEVVTDQYVITKGHRGNDVCFFSRQGKVLNRIHRVGNGPGEYKDIGSIDVNPANGELLPEGDEPSADSRLFSGRKVQALFYFP